MAIQIFENPKTVKVKLVFGLALQKNIWDLTWKTLLAAGRAKRPKPDNRRNKNYMTQNR